MLIPVIQCLQRKTDYTPVIFGLTTASKNLTQAGIPHYGYRDLVQDGDEKALEIGKKMAAALQGKSQINAEETIAYLGLSYQDMIDRLGEEEAARQFEQRGRQAFLPLSIMERAFKKFKPDLVIATNSPRSEKAAILTAGTLGIPSVCVMDLFDPREFEDRIGQPGYATRVCMFSDFAKQELITMGRKDEEIVVTGNPSFDSLADPELEAQAQAMVVERGWQGRTRILWARQPNPNDWDLYRAVEKKLMELLPDHPDWQLIIRPHPNDSTRFDNLPERVSLSTQNDFLPALVQASDLIITVNSTVGLQGVAIGKPLINVAMGFASPFTPYPEMGISLGIKKIEAMEAAIHKALSPDYKPRETLPKPGGSADAVVRLIRKLID